MKPVESDFDIQVSVYIYMCLCVSVVNKKVSKTGEMDMFFSFCVGRRSIYIFTKIELTSIEKCFVGGVKRYEKVCFAIDIIYALAHKL